MSNLRPALKRLIGKKDLVGVEIGVQFGKNAKIILDNLDVKKLYLVDPYVPYPNVSGAGGGMTGTTKSHIEIRSQAKNLLRNYENIIWINKYSWNAVENIEDNLDFVYIDGDHRYESVLKDIELYFPKVKIGGLISGHDAGHKQVKNAVSNYFSARNKKTNKDGPDWWYISDGDTNIHVRDGRCILCGTNNNPTKDKWKCKKCSKVNYTPMEILINNSVENNLFLFGIGRSGHHAIMNWICKQSIPSMYFNNCQITNNNIIRIGTPYVYDKDGIHNKYTSLKDYYFVIYNFSNYSPEDCIITDNDDLRIIVVVRDPYNFIASKKRRLPKKIEDSIKLWKKHVKICLEGKENIIDINYNKWFSDVSYRKFIIKKLSIPFTDSGINDVTDIMKGSSFDMMNFDGKAQEMKVLERWKYFRDDESYWNLIDDEIIELSKQYFDFCVEKP